MAAAHLKDKIIEPDDQAFIETFMSDNNQEVYWQGWVILYTKSNAASKKERILVVTNFRVFTVKHGVLKRSTRQSFPILDLEELTYSKDSDNQIHLTFAGQELDIQGEQVVDIAQAIIFAYKSITYNLPREKLPKIELPQRFFENFIAPEPDTQDGLLATYCAACDYVGCSQKLPVLDYFMTCFEIQDKVLDLGECLGPVEKVAVTDIQTVAAALRYTHWFDELIAVEYPIKDDGLTALSRIFGTQNSVISKLVLVNIKASKTGFAALAHEVALGAHSLKYLNVSKNNLGDSGVKVIVEAFQSSKKVLETLCLQSCAFSAKGFRDIVTVLNTPTWAAGLRVLDLSDNSAGKTGTQALAEYLRVTTALEQLYVMRTELVLETLLESLIANTQLSQHVLTTLNLSGNKVSKQSIPLLATLLKDSHSLTHLYLVECALPRQAFVDLMDAALANPHGVRYWLELTGNDLGPKGAKELADLLAKRNKKVETIHTLILNNNNLAPEGVIAICQSLSGTNIHTLSLDSNIKLGMFVSNTKEAGEAVASFMNSTPALRELSIAGDDSHYLKAAGLPILTALRTNTNLLYLDVSRNRLGDEGIKLLADALAVNRTLTSFTAERNRVGIKGLRELHKAVLANGALTDWAIPMTDIENIHNSASVKVVKELKQIVFDFEMTMERNLESLQKQPLASDSLAPPGDLPPGSGNSSRRASLHFEDAPRRGEPAGSVRPTRKAKPHTRTASDMFANFAKTSNPEDAAADDADGDGDVDPDAEEPTEEKLEEKPEEAKAEQD